ncbi:MAG: TadE family protein [Planctomycetota bacterium]
MIDSLGSQKRKRRRRRGSRDGATLVEFAIIANILFVMIFACIEFARLNMVRNLAMDAAYFAARKAMVPGATTGEAIAEAEGIMSSMLGSGYTIEVQNLDDATETVEVTVNVDLHEVALFTPMFLPNDTLESKAQMRTERYAGFYEQ